MSVSAAFGFAWPLAIPIKRPTNRHSGIFNSSRCFAEQRLQVTLNCTYCRLSCAPTGLLSLLSVFFFLVFPSRPALDHLHRLTSTPHDFKIGAQGMKSTHGQASSVRNGG